MKVKIIADSTCDLPEELLTRFDIDVVPLYVIMDDASYKDKLEMMPEKLIEWSNKTKQTPKTSAPTVDDYLFTFKPYVDAGRDIVFISVSSLLSATCQNAHFAANMLDKGNIVVIDGKSVTIGTGSIVIKAAELAKEGKSAEEIAKKIEAIIPKVKAGFIFDNLEFLRRGGRCSALKAFSASALKIRPRIDAIDGQLIPVEKFRGSLEKVTEKFCDGMLENLDEIDPEFIFVASTQDNGNLLEAMFEKVRSKNYFKNIYEAKAGCIITAHSGPDAYAIVYIKK